MQLPGPVEQSALPSAKRSPAPESRGRWGERPAEASGEHSGVAFGEYAKRIDGRNAAGYAGRGNPAPGSEGAAPGARQPVLGGAGEAAGAEPPASAAASVIPGLAPRAGPEPLSGSRMEGVSSPAPPGPPGAQAMAPERATGDVAAASRRTLAAPAAAAMARPGLHRGGTGGAEGLGASSDGPNGPSQSSAAPPTVTPGRERPWVEPATGTAWARSQTGGGTPGPAGEGKAGGVREAGRGPDGVIAGEKGPEGGRLSAYDPAVDARAAPGGRAERAPGPAHAESAMTGEAALGATDAERWPGLRDGPAPRPRGPDQDAAAGFRAAAARGSATTSGAPLENVGGSSVGPGGAVSPAIAAGQNAVPVQSAGAVDFARAVTAQIAGAVAGEAGSARIELRLDPPELGRLEISLEIVDQSVRATVAADRTGTHDLLRRHADMLLAQLQQAGFSDVDLRFGGEHHRAPGRGQTAEAGHGEAEHPDQGEARVGGAASPAVRTQGLDLRF